jgi:hypothetical protein
MSPFRGGSKRFFLLATRFRIAPAPFGKRTAVQDRGAVPCKEYEGVP